METRPQTENEKNITVQLIKIQDGIRYIMDLILCVYLVLMITVMPFYFQEGYVHIATDKALLCRRINTAALQGLLPLFLISMILSFGTFLLEHKGRLTGAVWREQLRGIGKKVTLPDLFIGFYGLALTISYLCSNYRENALWGAEDGWYTGFLPQISLIAAYFFIAKCWKPRKKIFYLLFPASAAVFLLGYLNRFGVYPIDMISDDPGFISTIGHLNWYCGYAVTVLFAGIGLLWKSSGRNWRNLLFYGYALLGFGTLVTQGSMSGIVTLGLMGLVIFVLSASNGSRMYNFWVLAALLSSACLFTELLRVLAPKRLNMEDEAIDLLTTGAAPIVILILSCLSLALLGRAISKGRYPEKHMHFFTRALGILASCVFVLMVTIMVINTKNPGKLGWLSEYPAFTFSDSWGNYRGILWKTGAGCFWEQDLLHKLTGVGPDALSAYLYQDGSEGLQQMLYNVYPQEGAIMTNAHNEWLTVLVNTGILGLVSFLGMMITAIVTFLKKAGEASSAHKNNCAVYCGCGFSLLAYTINNIFSFQQTVNLTTMIVILGMGMAFTRAESASGCNV